MTDRPRFRIEVQAEPGNYLAPVHRRLARLLKAMLRGYGFRCTHVKPVEADQEKPGSHSDQ